MNKCFITKLPSSIDNDNLPILGQLRIKWLKANTSTDANAHAIGFNTNSNITVKLYGAHFTDDTLKSNLGNSMTITPVNDFTYVHVSNDTNDADAVMTVDDKYSLTKLHLVGRAGLDLEDIKYCNNINTLNLNYKKAISWDISAVSKMTNLTILTASNSSVVGDISAVRNLVNLCELNVQNTSISGDISAVSELINLTYFNIYGTQISGDISVVSKMTNLNELCISGLVSGDMSKIPAKTVFISRSNSMLTTNVTWTAKGRQNANILAMEGSIPLDTASMDNMLIDQATCTFTPVASRPWYSVISVNGTRTSASDAAVATIQSKGVTIIGVTKAS